VHDWFKERAGHWPHALSASTTHDTKRSEDARARLHVLSELPREWRREVRAWSRLNRRFKGELDGRPAPGSNLEYYYYQTLIAAWDGPPTTDFRQRIAGHMTKAMREAKEATAWTRVNEPFEDTVLGFVRATLDGRRSRRFLERLQRFSDRIAPAAGLNSLGMLTLKATAPGVPDFYQGSEGVLATLTDPDNRRPVDFAALDALCPDGGAWPPGEGNGLSPQKFALTRALLGLRARHPGVFTDGKYVPLEVRGELWEHAFAFLRQKGREWVMVVVPRLVARLGRTGGVVSAETWGDTAVEVDVPVPVWRDALMGDEIAGGPLLPLADLLRETPVGLFEGSSGR
jgi:(1->4)-alpha-D-glucan 1-alpha-D-glucosylmutase